ncbi:hypothetical protein Gorai_000967 [Gossypium raimondii]|uniref:Transmembrane protein n=1 Tax=Gossypium raimondii TaxID=29730 RepID=A0A7J8PFE7_GOSRA|nr:hypothetical protein [Gossypium raimondii]
MLSLSDLEADHLNPFEASTRINSIVLPEFLLQGFLCISFLLTWHWFMFLFTLPIAAYHLMFFSLFVGCRLLSASIFFFFAWKFEELDIRTSLFY